MGFDVNPINNKPIIREASSTKNDGGSGNTGYFQSRERQKRETIEESIFNQEVETDTFGNEKELEEELSLKETVARIIAEIILFFRNLFSLQSK